MLLVTPRWTRDGGVGAHVQVSAAALAEQGLGVDVLVAKVDAGDPVPSGVAIHHAPSLFDSSAPMHRRLGDAAPAPGVVVHLHQVDDPRIVGAFAASSPVVVSAHGYTACTSGVYYFEPGHECTRSHGLPCIPNFLARGCAHTRHKKTVARKFVGATRGRQALQGADLVVSYSSAVDRHLANNGLTRRAIVPYFPTMPASQGAGHELRRRVVFAGRIVRPKGVEVLIEAAQRVDAEFVLCGDGRELEEMRALVERLGLEERVRFTGWLDADGLARELAEASVVTVPSLWPEPFGLVGIEAFAAGRPAVASATGGIGDWLIDGSSGLAVAPGDAAELAGALVELLSDPERQARMGLAGKQIVEQRFSARRHVAVLLDAYESASSHWRSSRPGTG